MTYICSCQRKGFGQFENIECKPGYVIGVCKKCGLVYQKVEHPYLSGGIEWRQITYVIQEEPW